MAFESKWWTLLFAKLEVTNFTLGLELLLNSYLMLEFQAWPISCHIPIYWVLLNIWRRARRATGLLLGEREKREKEQRWMLFASLRTTP
jgi:hypothetical protein